jgi:quinol monooxygenase YgiN
MSRSGERATTEGGSDVFAVTARLKVRDRELEGFKRQAAEVMKATRELDTKTIRYDWYLSDDGTECEVRERYVDADALVEHAQHIADARNALFRDFADDHTVVFYAEPSLAFVRGARGNAAWCRGPQEVLLVPVARRKR